MVMFLHEEEQDHGEHDVGYIYHDVYWRVQEKVSYPEGEEDRWGQGIHQGEWALLQPVKETRYEVKEDG